MMRFANGLLCAICLLALPACSRSKTSGEAPRPPEAERVRPRSTAFGGKQEAAPAEGEGSDDKGEKKGVLSRIFSSGASTPGYAWDGQMSSTTMKSSVASVQTRAIETVRSLGFVINTEETKRQGATARVTAAKADRTSVLIMIEEKVAGSSEVKVRVGQTGDRGSSERILDELQKPPAAKPAPKKAAPAATPAPEKK
ncbi:MAG TPA: DUF3568 family protein [Planctomycetota bacterium]|nr:DUF3568 family protein [Planctomycetota bacterium]